MQSPDPVPSFSQLPQDGTSFGNLGKVGFRDLTTYNVDLDNVDLEIRPLCGSFRESFQNGDDDETPPFYHPSGTGFRHKLLAGLCCGLLAL